MSKVLFDAARSGNAALVQTALESGADINAMTKKRGGKTALMEAALNGHLNVVCLLIEKGADVNLISKTGLNAVGGHTALTEACSHGHLEIVLTLIENGALINSQADNGLWAAVNFTPLMFAASLGHLAVVKALIEKGVRLNDATQDGITALISASMKGHADIVQALLENGADINVKCIERLGGPRTQTALMFARKNGHKKIEELLTNAAAVPRGKAAPSAIASAPNDVHAPKPIIREKTQIGVAPLMKIAVENKSYPPNPSTKVASGKWASRWGEPVGELFIVLLGIPFILYFNKLGFLGNQGTKYGSILLVLIFGRAILTLLQAARKQTHSE